MDTISPEKRSWVMSRIKSTGTKPEMHVRSLLRQNGFHYRLHVSKLPGKPDIVLTKFKTVVEVRGCFWHRHEHCKLSRIPKTNVDFWKEKFRRNVERDKNTEEELKSKGWNVLVLWECQLKHTHEIIIEPLLKLRQDMAKQ